LYYYQREELASEKSTSKKGRHQKESKLSPKREKNGPSCKKGKIWSPAKYLLWGGEAQGGYVPYRRTVGQRKHLLRALLPKEAGQSRRKLNGALGKRKMPFWGEEMRG